MTCIDVPEQESAQGGTPEPEQQRAIARPTGWMWMAELAAVAWLALLGLAATIVGGHDAVVGAEITVRLVGTLLFAGGVVLLVGAFGLLQRRPAGLTLAMIAALLGAAIGVMLCLTQVVNDEPDERIVLWATIVVASAATAIYIRKLTPPAERAKSIWSRLPILKSAISVGLLFSIAQFWYSNIYVSTKAPPSVTLDAKIGKVVREGDHLVIQGSVVIRNTSKTNVYVLASTLNLAGSRFGAADIDAEQYARDILDADRGRYGTVDRHLGADGPTVVSHGRLVDEGTSLEPDETLTVPVITRVPKGTYSAMYLKASLVGGRGDSLGFNDPGVDEPELVPNDEQVVYLTPLPQAGWLRELTRGDRYLRVEYDPDPMESPLVLFAPDREPDPPEGFDARLTRFYGVALFDSQDVIALP